MTPSVTGNKHVHGAIEQVMDDLVFGSIRQVRCFISPIPERCALCYYSSTVQILSAYWVLVGQLQLQA